MVVKALILPGIPLAVGILWKRLHRDKSGCKSNKKMSDLAAKLLKEIEAMDGRVGYDAIIVCCSTLQQVREKAVRIFTFQGIYIDLWNVEGFRRFRRSAFTGRIQMRSVALVCARLVPPLSPLDMYPLHEMCFIGSRMRKAQVPDRLDFGGFRRTSGRAGFRTPLGRLRLRAP